MLRFRKIENGQDHALLPGRPLVILNSEENPLWLAVWRVLAVCVTFGTDCAGKALYRALIRSVWTWAGNSVGGSDGIPSSVLTE